MTNLQHQDNEHRKLALDPRQSFIVQAPAGSGKTTLLIQRFLTLLQYVSAPEEILAITFTKKAANEMRVRVIQALKQAEYETEPTSEHAKNVWKLAKQVLVQDKRYQWNLINNPNQLRIQTIDSLCTYLTKQLPLLSHFGSQPDISDTPTLLYQEAVQEVLTHIEEELPWTNAIATLLLHLDNDLNKLHDLLIHLLAKRDQWLPYIHLESNAHTIKSQLENTLGLIIANTLKQAHRLIPKTCIPDLIRLARYAASHLASSDSPILACQDLTSLPDANTDDLPIWLGLTKLLLTDDGHWRKQVNASVGFPAPSAAINPQEKALYAEYKSNALLLINQLIDQEALRNALVNITHLPEAFYQPSQWEVLKALLQVLKVTAAQLRVTFQQHGQIDFIENTQAAITALGDIDSPTNLALALDYQIKHILVDEFQDTSFTQYQLLEKLTAGWESNDGRTLFVVGDPMQSIYRFREAEVGLFIRMRNYGIGHLKLIPLTLNVNFRSTSTIVDWNNQHFKTIFPTSDDMLSGAVSYSPSISSMKDQNTSITVTGFTDEHNIEQSKKIISIIQNSDPNEKIAILVRARQHLKNIIPLLKKANIPYRAVEIDPLGERQIIQDLLSLTRAMIHPADKIAWLSVLRAPWCGLSLADLYIISNNSPYTIICEQLNSDAIIKQLSLDGQQRLARLWPILKSSIAERERHSIRSWIENTWLALGGPAYLNDFSEINDVACFFNLLNEFSQGQESLNLNKLQIKIDKLYAQAQTEESAVQLMTIHSSKGLEFDTVILPHLERKNAVDASSLLSWMEFPLEAQQSGFLLAPIHATGDEQDSIYHYISRQQQIKTDYEMDRLLYVAATRSKKNLHLLFHSHQKENGNYTVESGSFLKKLWPFFANQTSEIFSISNEIKNNPDAELNTRYLYRLKSNWTNPFELNLFTSSAHNKSSGFILPDPIPRLQGTVIHKILQMISLHGEEWWLDKQDSYTRLQLSLLHLPHHAIEEAIKRINVIIANVLNDERGRWILKPHRDAKSEFAISTSSENHVIDRTFIDEEGVRWIVDYKSSPTIDDFEKYQDKMNQYAEAMRLLEDRPVKLGLYYPAIPDWREW